MFFTFCYVFLTYYRQYYDAKVRSKLNQLLDGEDMFRTSFIYRNLQKTVLSLSKSDRYSKFVDLSSQQYSDTIVLELGQLQVLRVQPKLYVNLRKWTSYLSSQSEFRRMIRDDELYVLLEAYQPDDPEEYLNRSLSIPRDKRVKVVDHATPIAWHSGIPFGIILSCPLENFGIMGRAFIKGTLVMDDVLEIQEMMSVSADGEPAHLLRIDSQSDYAVMSDDRSSQSSESLSRKSINRMNSISEASVPGDDSNEPVDSYEVAQESEVVFDMAYDDTTNNSPTQYVNNTVSCYGDNNRWKGNMKPPNVLIYCGKKDSSRLYNEVKVMIERCLNKHSYVVYHLTHQHVFQTPWRENIEMLVVASDKLYDGVDMEFRRYLDGGGKLMSLCSPLDKFYVETRNTSTASVVNLEYGGRGSTAVISGNYVYDVTEGGHCEVIGSCQQPVIVQYRHGDSRAIFTQVHLERGAMEMAINPDTFDLLKKSSANRLDILQGLLTLLDVKVSDGCDIPEMTPCFMHTPNKDIWNTFFNSLSTRIKDGRLKSTEVILHFLSKEEDVLESRESSTISVVTDGDWGQTGFDVGAYYHHLNTQVMGKVLMYADVIPTTMNIFDGMMFLLPSVIGVICIAGQQTAGRGRGGNSFISPRGCAMFSVLIRLPLDSPLGRSPSFLQHMLSLATARAVRTLPGYQDIDIRLKWPNDIYYGRDVKMGGVIVTSTVMRDTLYAVMGCGFNVSNSSPTICLNDIVDHYNQSHLTHLSPCTREQVIARTMNEMEELIAEFQLEGATAFCDRYYQYWLHSKQKITLESEGNIEVTVEGLDHHGYLSVCTPEGAIITVAPDGNTFDMMRNLIRFKPS